MNKKYTTTIIGQGTSEACGIEIPFDPEEVFGRVRMSVNVTLRGHTYRTTIARMGGVTVVPLNKANRAAAGGVGAGDRVQVTVEADAASRDVEVPAELARAMRRQKGATAAWKEWSFTKKREAAESLTGARKPETRERRLQKILKELS